MATSGQQVLPLITRWASEGALFAGRTGFFVNGGVSMKFPRSSLWSRGFAVLATFVRAVLTSRAGVLLCTLGMATFHARALDLPYQLVDEGRLDNHQFIWNRVTVDQTGLATLEAKFSNGKQLDGDHFFSWVHFVNSAGKSVVVVKQAKGIDSSWGGKGREAWETNQFRMSPAEWREIVRVDIFRNKVSNCNDEEIWKKIATTALKAYYTGGVTYTDMASTGAQVAASCKKL